MRINISELKQCRNNHWIKNGSCEPSLRAHYLCIKFLNNCIVSDLLSMSKHDSSRFYLSEWHDPTIICLLCLADNWSLFINPLLLLNMQLSIRMWLLYNFFLAYIGATTYNKFLKPFFFSQLLKLVMMTSVTIPVGCITILKCKDCLEMEMVAARNIISI